MSILLAIAPNGARKTKTDHPNIPLTAVEIGKCAMQCLDAGAAMIHLHVRDKNQRHSLSVTHYKEAIKQIKKQTNDGVLIQVTSEAVGVYSAEQQFSMIHELQPPAVSIGLREIKALNEKDINQHFIRMRKNKVLPQLILYNTVDYALYKEWLQRGVLIGSAYPLLFVIGKKQPEGAFEQVNLLALSKKSNKPWMVCAFGEQEFSVAKEAVRLGGHVRLGFENNILLKTGITATNNAEIISQISRHLKLEKKFAATSNEAEQIMQPDW